MIAEEGLGTEEYSRIRHLAERWKSPLPDLGDGPTAIQRRLAKNGLERTPATIAGWLGNPDRIGPGDYDDIEAIATVAGDIELLSIKDEVRSAISRIRGAHLTAGVHLTQLILVEIGSRLDELGDQPTLLDLDYGMRGWSRSPRLIPSGRRIPRIRLTGSCGPPTARSDGASLMASMIPARIDDDRISSGERRVFGLLKNDPATADWTVLHSLGLARRPTGPYGEIDFVVIIPGEGVVCLEVKGGRLACDAGVWRTMDRHGNVVALKKSPFLQARDSMFALRDATIRHFGETAPEGRCPMGCAVVFPDVPCPPDTPEFERSDAIDSDDLRGPISRSVMRVVRRRLREFQPRQGQPRPSGAEARAIRNFLRPDFEMLVAKGVSVGRTEEKLLRLTEEQYARLDELEANPRCLFEGAAGTGKTLLALEYARRASASGSKVALVCFNRLLGEWLQQQTRGTGVVAGTWHGIVRHFILESSIADEFRAEERTAHRGGDAGALFAETYPLYGELALEELGTPFDVVVMDEAQDLCRPNILDILNVATAGGLAGGSWAIFGDFTRQALYGGAKDPVAALVRYCDHFVRARLTLNCRNTRRIAEETTLVAGFDRPPFRLADEMGLAVEHRYWKTPDDLVESLASVVDRLVNEAMPIEDVMVLSPRRLENSGLAGVGRISRFPLVDVSRGTEGAQQVLKFSTIHSFKGLESPAVVIVDIQEVDSDEHQSLLYVAMSRARSLLILMTSRSARRSLERRIQIGMQRELEL